MTGQQLKNVVFGGTGVRNPAYAGALLALEERGLYRGITGFGGCSAGAIVAALAGVGYTPEEVLDRMIAIDFKRILGGSFFFGPARMLRKFGWYKADYLVETLGEMIAERMGDALVDIETCEAKTGNRIRIVGTNLSRRMACVFPSAALRHVPLVEAVRISMSIPWFFEAQRLERELYVDGGVLWNLPVELFDVMGEPNDGTLGFIVREPNQKKPTLIERPHQYMESLLRTLARSQEGSLDSHPSTRGRVVQIDDLDIAPTDFGISDPQKWALVEAGRVATHALFESRRHVPVLATATGGMSI